MRLFEFEHRLVGDQLERQLLHQERLSGGKSLLEQLDHALANGLPAGSRATGRVRAMTISDHRAVLVDLTLGTPEP